MAGGSSMTTAGVPFLRSEDGIQGRAGGGEVVSMEEVSERTRPFSQGLS